MSEPMSYALSVAIPAPNLRDWLSASCPGPRRWNNWKSPQISWESVLFNLTERQRGRQLSGEHTRHGAWHTPPLAYFCAATWPVLSAPLTRRDAWETKRSPKWRPRNE